MPRISSTELWQWGHSSSNFISSWYTSSLSSSSSPIFNFCAYCKTMIAFWKRDKVYILKQVYSIMFQTWMVSIGLATLTQTDGMSGFMFPGMPPVSSTLSTGSTPPAWGLFWAMGPNLPTLWRWAVMILSVSSCLLMMFPWQVLSDLYREGALGVCCFDLFLLMLLFLMLL